MDGIYLFVHFMAPPHEQREHVYTHTDTQEARGHGMCSAHVDSPDYTLSTDYCTIGTILALELVGTSSGNIHISATV